ncbi:hypothetical protein DP939_32615 [Spongiactinospora rosea]|uniref:Uncharacterized protein n=1 Tax=Spongiactinospora rosea TaxID=2248750 RepID=A0A366LRX1_9ACTN|nr:hypothetical protein [Spongiactinospora rosea]RBQ16054.1 hypothetical protein DP939_32615 [Spongiactinospora rosea]
MRSGSSWRALLIPVLVLAGMALFLNGQAASREPAADAPAVHQVRGTAADYRTFTDRAGSGNRTTTVVVFALKLAEFPENVTFRLERPPPGGVPQGTPVRLELPPDAAETVQRAGRFPAAEYTVKAIGAEIGGQSVYSAAEGAGRAAGASRAFRLAALACVLLAAGWAAAVLWWRRRPG